VIKSRSLIVAALLLSTPLHAQTAQQPVKANSQSLGQGLAVATLLGCTSKKAGQPATQAFYTKIQGAVKEAEGYCKANQPGMARLTIIRNFRENRMNPVVTAAYDCYTKNKQALDAMAGPQIAGEINKYIHLLHDPSNIEREVTLDNVCRKK
jgi:hypothetical protein